MSEGSTGLLVFFAIAIVSAVLWHRVVEIFSVAVVGATITAVVAFQIAAYWHAGHVDPFVVVAVVTTAAMSLVISILIGLPIRKRRRNAKDSTHAF